MYSIAFDALIKKLEGLSTSEPNKDNMHLHLANLITQLNILFSLLTNELRIFYFFIQTINKFFHKCSDTYQLCLSLCELNRVFKNKFL